MSLIEEFNTYYNKVMYELLPELQDKYVVETLLKQEEGKSIVLVKSLADGKRYVLKYSEDAKNELSREYEALKRLQTEEVHFVKYDDYEYLIRPYIEGVSLEQKIENDGVFDEHKTTELLLKLCDRLESMNTGGIAVVHRDIKPANIILTPEGDVRLIDFECARNYDEEKEKDTVFIGTVHTAAPEQYGYSQSDVRTDIYAIGKTLCYALTESYDAEELDRIKVSGKLKHIINKCTEFNPKDRYQSIKSLRAALSGKMKKRCAAVVALLAVIGILAAAIGTTMHQKQTVVFSSSALEKAVRAELGKPKGDITYAELAGVKRLAVIGMETFSVNQVYRCMQGNYVDDVRMDENCPQGDIEDLSLLKDMDNLEELYLCYQEISDITPLSKLHLRTLSLAYNNIADITPLEGMTSIENLYLALNPIESYEPIATLGNLEELNLDRQAEHDSTGVRVPPLDCLSGLPIRNLSLGCVEPISGGFSFAENLEKLEYVYLAYPKEEYLADIAKAPKLDYIFLNRYLAGNLEPLAASESLHILNICGQVYTLQGVNQIKNLNVLNIGMTEDVDLSYLEGANALESLWMNNAGAYHYDVLSKLPALLDVNINKSQEEQFHRECPEYDFILNVVD